VFSVLFALLAVSCSGGDSDAGVELGENTDIFGSCARKFEPLAEGIFEGESPELIVQVQAGSQFYDQMLTGYADTEVAGIGDGALSRAEGEIIFVSKGNSGTVGTLLAYDVEQMEQAGAAAEERSRLLADRIEPVGMSWPDAH
jgi:hypothetical protein